MAKKKNRRLNIARRREKRQQNQKSKRKQLALRKQRLSQSVKSDEERLQDRIMNSRLLLNEPEFEGVTFDEDLLRQSMLELFGSDMPFSGDEERASDAKLAHVERHYHQDISEKFRCEVLPRLITPDFLHTMLHALRACETRLRRVGYRDKAEIALVARSLFELADRETLIFHPLVLKICARTLEQTLGHPPSFSEPPETAQNLLSDVLESGRLEGTMDAQHQVGDKTGVTHLDTASPPEEQHAPESKSESTLTTVRLENLPAKALYKNFEGLGIRDAIEAGNGYRMVESAEDQIEFVHTHPESHITLTADRLLLRCSSKAQLEIAMSEIEQLCGSTVFYLAKTIDDA